MSKESKKYLADFSYTDIVIGSFCDENGENHHEFMLSDLLDRYLKYRQDDAKESMQVRRETFKNKVLTYLHRYELSMLEQFTDYWTEHNERGRKMRFETHKIFNIEKRLATWSRNNKKYNKDDHNRYNVGEQDYTKRLSGNRQDLFAE